MLKYCANKLGLPYYISQIYIMFLKSRTYHHFYLNRFIKYFNFKLANSYFLLNGSLRQE